MGNALTLFLKVLLWCCRHIIIAYFIIYINFLSDPQRMKSQHSFELLHLFGNLFELTYMYKNVNPDSSILFSLCSNQLEEFRTDLISWSWRLVEDHLSFCSIYHLSREYALDLFPLDLSCTYIWKFFVFRTETTVAVFDFWTMLFYFSSFTLM